MRYRAILLSTEISVDKCRLVFPHYTTARKISINYFLRIAYDGTDYGGWQRQANHPRTIQQTIEELLSQSLGEQIALSGCGRTDAGVHASQFYFYFRISRPLPKNFLYFMNKKLPNDIAFLEAIPVDEKAHVCLDATNRCYDYFFHDFADPWLERSSTHVDLMKFNPRSVAELLPELSRYNDYRQFCLTPDRHNSTIVEFSNATLFENKDANRFRIQFVANRFLRGMIRILMYDLILVGTGEMTTEKFVSMLGGTERGKPVQLAGPRGLYLTGVSYPYIVREPELPIIGQDDWELVSAETGNGFS